VQHEGLDSFSGSGGVRLFLMRAPLLEAPLTRCFIGDCTARRGPAATPRPQSPPHEGAAPTGGVGERPGHLRPTTARAARGCFRGRRPPHANRWGGQSNAGPELLPKAGAEVG